MPCVQSSTEFLDRVKDDLHNTIRSAVHEGNLPPSEASTQILRVEVIAKAALQSDPSNQQNVSCYTKPPTDCFLRVHGGERLPSRYRSRISTINAEITGALRGLKVLIPHEFNQQPTTVSQLTTIVYFTDGRSLSLTTDSSHATGFSRPSTRVSPDSIILN